MAQRRRFELWCVEQTLKDQGFPHRKALLLKVVDPMAIRNATAICAYFGIGLAEAEPMAALTLVAQVYKNRDWSVQPPGEIVERVEDLLRHHPDEQPADAIADDTFGFEGDPFRPGKYTPWSFLGASIGVTLISGAFGMATLWALGKPDAAASYVSTSLGEPGGFGSLDDFRERCRAMLTTWLEEEGGGTWGLESVRLPPSLVAWATDHQR